jgi:hypothetical protein
MGSEREVFLNIRVINRDTNIVYEHSSVPLDHVEILRMSPNLRVEVTGRARGGRRSDKNANNR